MLRSGFTLVELSIVLVILGLLVGGVLAGQSLIRSAELRAITTEKNNYVIALNAFKEKYMALPGDMANAYAFWGTDCGTDSTTASTGCNGDGNGLINNYDAISEGAKAWEHLSRAGLIEGNFDGTGVVTSGAALDVSNTNSPKSKFPSGLWNIGQMVCEGCGYGTPDVTLGHLFLAIGSPNPSDGGWIRPLPGLTNAEMWNIDTKLDDGMSERGNVRGINAHEACDDDSGNEPYRIATSNGATGWCVPHFMVK